MPWRFELVVGVQPNTIISDRDTTFIDLANGHRLTVYARRPARGRDGQPLPNSMRNATSIEFNLGGYPTAQSAQEGAHRLRDAVAVTGAGFNLGLDLHLDREESYSVRIYEEGIGRLAQFGEIAEVQIGRDVDGLLGAIRDDLELRAPSSGLAHAARRFTGALLESSATGRLVGLTSALEAVIERQDETEEYKAVLEELEASVDQSSLSLKDKKDLKAELENLKQETISRAVRRLAQELLPGRRYRYPDEDALTSRELSSRQFAHRSYVLRGRIVHGDATVDPAYVKRVATPLAEFVRDIIVALRERDNG